MILETENRWSITQEMDKSYFLEVKTTKMQENDMNQDL